MTQSDIFRRILAQGWRYRHLTLLLFAGTAAVGGMTTLQASLLKTILEQMQGLKGHTEGLGAAVAELNRVALWLLAGAPIMAFLAYGSWVVGQYLANCCTRDLRAAFVSHLVRQDLAFHGDLARGELLTRMTADLDRLYNVQSVLFGRLLQRPAVALGAVVYVFIASWQLGVAVFVILVPVGLVIARILRTTRKRSQRAQERLADALTAFEQVTAGIRVIKTMGSTEREVQRYDGLNEALFSERQRMARARARSEAVTQGSIWLIGGVAFLIAGWMFNVKLIDPPAFITVLMAFGLLINALRESQRGWADVVEGLPSAERVFQLLDRAPALVDRHGAPAAPAPRTAIRLDQVGFRYQPDAADVVAGLNLEITVGQVTALVGPSGGGKSTVLDLIPRLRDVTGGRVLWDGQDVRDVQADSLMHHVAIVSQESFLFNDTVFNNIRYGRPAATREEVEAAARRAHVHEAIHSLEGGQGYDTVVGDRGGRLSGGQRQRIAIARALLRDAPILLLDEPTSALDAESERHVQAALAELMLGRTVVVVAHRLATVQHADAIHVIGSTDGGPSTVLESGTHEGLVALNGHYARLVALQQL